MKRRTYDCLISRGVNPGILGFSAMGEFLEQCIECPDKLYTVCDTYKTVGEALNRSASSVERTIRHAISGMYSPYNDMPNSQVLADCYYALTLED